MDYTQINDRPKSVKSYIRDVIKHKRLIRSFSIRNLHEIYSGNIQGLLTSFIQPLISLAFFSVFFGLLVRFNTGVEYPLYAFSGLIVWNLFSMSFVDVMTSLNKYTAVISKMYFPRIIIPISALANSVFTALVSYLLLLVATWIMGHPFNVWLFLFPLVIVITVMFSFSLALWLSYKSLIKKELIYIIPGIIGFGSWITPVFYPTSLIPEPYTWLIYLNPLTIIVCILRWSIFEMPFPPVQYLAVLLIPVMLLLLSLWYFIRKDRFIADCI